MITLRLQDIVKKENLSLQRNASMREVIDLININKKGVVAIVENNRPVGILTERDIVEILFNEYDLDESVNKFSHKRLITTSGNRTIGYALNLMLDNNIRRLIVTDMAENFIGIVTQQDLLKFLEEDFYRSTIKVKHILDGTESLISVSPDDSLRRVLSKMVKNKISAVVVLSNSAAVGIITEKDILKLSPLDVSLDEHVGRFMTSPVMSAHQETPLNDIVKTMNERDIRRVVIVNDDEAAIDVITVRDVAKNLEGDYNNFLERKLKNAKDVLNLLSDMLIEVTDTGDEQYVIWANDKVINCFGREILDKPVTDFIPEESWDKIHDNIKTLNKIENIKIKKGEEIYELSGFFIPTDGKTEKGRYQLLMKDITEEVKLSTEDPLTEIYNRRFINEFLGKEVARCLRQKKQFSVVICDIDDFKQMNDTYGHLSGDAVLKAFSQAILGTLRDLDVVGRYGGDEFVIILPEASKENTALIVDRIRAEIQATEITVGKEVKVGIASSFGTATYPEDGTSSDDLLIRADEELYRDKSSRKKALSESDLQTSQKR